MLAGWLADFMVAHAGIFGVFIEDKKVNFVGTKFHNETVCIICAEEFGN